MHNKLLKSQGSATMVYIVPSIYKQSLLYLLVKFSEWNKFFFFLKYSFIYSTTPIFRTPKGPTK